MQKDQNKAGKRRENKVAKGDGALSLLQNMKKKT